MCQDSFMGGWSNLVLISKKRLMGTEELIKNIESYD